VSASEPESSQPVSGLPRAGHGAQGIHTGVLLPRSLSGLTLTLLVVTSMVGTGVFSTTGLLVEALDNRHAVMLAWFVGGLGASAGALAYADLSAALPRNGGEYALLSRIYHPAMGFVAAVASLFAGFAGPAAAMALAFGGYVQKWLPVSPLTSAVSLVCVWGVIHAFHVSHGARLQNLLTWLKLILIGGFLVAAVVWGRPEPVQEVEPRALTSALLEPRFAWAVMLVSFSYSGWNAASYLAGEVRQPGRSLFWALGVGVVCVTVLYLALNAVFLWAAPLSALSGVIEVADVAAVKLLGERGGRWVSAVVAFGLCSSVGGLVLAGPRIYESVGHDYPRLGWLAQRGAERGPWRAIALQCALTLLLLFSATFEQLLGYVGFVLSVFSALSVAGVFVLDRREPNLPRPLRTPLPVITCGLSLVILLGAPLYALAEQPELGLGALATALLGLVVWRWARPC
jgi:basic amino acid/polyamine antiporter, APA family